MKEQQNHWAVLIGIGLLALVLSVGCGDTIKFRYDSFMSETNCRDFGTWRQAQTFFEAAGGPDYDPHRLDPDRDGIACEMLPGAP